MHILHTTPKTDGFPCRRNLNGTQAVCSSGPNGATLGAAAAGRHERHSWRWRLPLHSQRPSPCWSLRHSTRRHVPCCRRRSVWWKWRRTTPGREMSVPPLSAALPEAFVASTGVSTPGAVWRTGCIFRGTRTTMWHGRSATCSGRTPTTAGALSWKAAASTATARELSSPRKAACAAPDAIRR